MGEKQMNQNTVNTLANIADAAYQRKTALALEEANAIAEKLSTNDKEESACSKKPF